MSSNDPPPRTTDEPDLAGKYVMLERLAVGGMGELLLARATGPAGFGKFVVIKRIRPEFAARGEFVQMFLNEARLSATLDHVNIVRTYELVEEEEGFFIVMEYLHGEPLGRMLNAAHRLGVSIPLAAIVAIAQAAADGLHYAHERRGLDGRPLGLVHRDISPGNIFVTFDGAVKVLDFGVAKATARTAVTRGTVLKGKAAYMSPEQSVGKEIDRRSDVFALGILLWEMCSSQRLFIGDNEFAVMNRVARAEIPDLAELVPELPAALVAIVNKALQADPDDRYATALSLRLALEDFASAQGLSRSKTVVCAAIEGLCDPRPYPTMDTDPGLSSMRSAATLRSLAEETRVDQAPVRRWALVLPVLLLGVGLGTSATWFVGRRTPPLKPVPLPTPTAVALDPPAGGSEESMPDAVVTPPPAEPVSGTSAPPSAASVPADVGAHRGRRRSGRRKRRSKTAGATKGPVPPPKPTAGTDPLIRGVHGLLPSKD